MYLRNGRREQDFLITIPLAIHFWKMKSMVNTARKKVRKPLFE